MVKNLPPFVIPAKAGIYAFEIILDSRLRGNDNHGGTLANQFSLFVGGQLAMTNLFGACLPAAGREFGD